MLADPLTRGMTLKVFHEHNAHMGVIPDSTLVEWESYVLYLMVYKYFIVWIFYKNKVEVNHFIISLFYLQHLCCVWIDLYKE